MMCVERAISAFGPACWLELTLNADSGKKSAWDKNVNPIEWPRTLENRLGPSTAPKTFLYVCVCVFRCKFNCKLSAIRNRTVIRLSCTINHNSIMSFPVEMSSCCLEKPLWCARWRARVSSDNYAAEMPHETGSVDVS